MVICATIGLQVILGSMLFTWVSIQSYPGLISFWSPIFAWFDTALTSNAQAVGQLDKVGASTKHLLAVEYVTVTRPRAIKSISHAQAY